MRTVGDLTLVKDRIAPYATVSAALRQMRETGHRVLAVVDDESFRGIVTRDRAQSAAPDSPVREVLETLVIELASSTNVRSAARLFVENGLDCVPVVSESGFQGLLTANQLLTELGRSWDPMTGLSWSDRLREWGIENLEAGREVTFVFFDLNDFGEYNKRHGHIIGDRILRAMAKALSSLTRDERDVLVRYGGDEFVFGSSRNRAEVEALVQPLRHKALKVEGVEDEVTFSVGIAGGKRTRERERTHFSSTLDNLINLASRDSLGNKRKAQWTPARPEAALVEAPLPVSHCFVELRREDSRVIAIASVRLKGESGIGLAEDDHGDDTALVGRAVSQALSKIRPETSVDLEDVVFYRRWDGLPVAIVECAVRQRQGGVRVSASAPSDLGVYSAMATAMLQAMIKGSEELGRQIRLDG